MASAASFFPSYPRSPYVRVTIATPDGVVLDQFQVCHWRADDSQLDDAECIGSSAAHALLVARLARYVEVKP